MILNFIVLYLFSISCSFFIKFIDFCFGEGNILENYYIFISKKYYLINEKLFKVLGGCIYCFGSWLYILMFILFNFYYQLPLIFIVLGIGINYISLEIIEKYLSNE